MFTDLYDWGVFRLEGKIDPDLITDKMIPDLSKLQEAEALESQTTEKGKEVNLKNDPGSQERPDAKGDSSAEPSSAT